ncbi:MAG: DUF1326 domain-containing protein [Acidobacteriota bacterium]
MDSGRGRGVTPQTDWRLSGEELASCSCDWGCPCQFNARPTTGHCAVLVAWRIDKGHFQATSLDGVVFGSVVWFPGAVHEGDGKILHIVDDKATPAQRAAIEALVSGQHGGAAFEIFAAVTPHKLGTISAPIAFASDREARTGHISIPGVGTTKVEPIRNPVTGEAHRARIELPNGFEYKVAEMGNTVSCSVNASGVAFDLQNTYAQLNRFEWSPA